MTYGLTATSKLASDKQVALIVSLASERGEINDGEAQETIMNAIEGKIVTSSEARHTIDLLFATPKIKKVAAAKTAAKAGGVLDGLPLSNYAVEVPGEGLVFLRVAEFKGTVYLRQLIGAPGSFTKIKPVGARRALLAGKIKEVGAAAAAKRYADEYTVCAVCNSELTDEVSRARGIGPVCWKKF